MGLGELCLPTYLMRLNFLSFEMPCSLCCVASVSELTMYIEISQVVVGKNTILLQYRFGIFMALMKLMRNTHMLLGKVSVYSV